MSERLTPERITAIRAIYGSSYAVGILLAHSEAVEADLYDERLNSAYLNEWKAKFEAVERENVEERCKSDLLQVDVDVYKKHYERLREALNQVRNLLIDAGPGGCDRVCNLNKPCPVCKAYKVARLALSAKKEEAPDARQVPLEVVAVHENLSDRGVHLTKRQVAEVMAESDRYYETLGAEEDGR